jgi:hypothetical protein
MRFNSEKGILEIADLVLSRHINVLDLIRGSKLTWEDWSYEGEHALGGARSVFDLSYSNGKKNEIILIVHFEKKNGEILYWDIGPKNLSSDEIWGTKKRLIKANKEWFEKETGVHLPVRGKWGEAIVSFDAHNLTASVLGLYHEYLVRRTSISTT